MNQSMERLQKVIAHSGLTSRRKAEQLIVDGKVKVNDQVVTKLGTRVSPKDQVKVNDIPIEKETPVYFLFYKPREVISTVDDDRNRTTVIDYFQAVEERIYPIGRLDYHSSGLIILTNDGEFANLLMHPRYEIEKEYVTRVKGVPKRRKLQQLRRGVQSEGDNLKAKHVRLLSINEDHNDAILEITLQEGKNRQVRRMMDSLGYPVKKLKREKYGFLTLAGLQPGQYRPLTPHEVKSMRDLALANVEK